MPTATTRPIIHATAPAPPPRWAVMQRYVFDQIEQAAAAYVDRYTNPDGSLIWRDTWPGMDGSDDGYEAFTSFPLCYALGGGEALHTLSRKQWNAVTKQFTQYGQVHNEFDAYYDWMHHGESSQYFYYFGLADPNIALDRDRAVRFAGMYMGEDSEADNWDADLKLIRSPINGSKGPRFEMTAEDWSTHREVLSRYLSPYEDVPGFPQAGDPMTELSWLDDEVFAEILARLNARMARGDVPLNLTCTSLVTNAFHYTNDEKYRRWVLDYLAAWEQRTADNEGIMPDNVGLSGAIGEHMDGKWWGGYYGWRWPHGCLNLTEASTIAGMNAALLTGDTEHLNLARSQLDLLWSLGRDGDDGFVIPWRHGDDGWFDYRAPKPELFIQLYYMSHSEEDRVRLERFGDAEQWRDVSDFGKGGQFGPGPWHAFIEGKNPTYPEQVLDASLGEIVRRLDTMRHDDAPPESVDVHHWQDINPVVAQGLLQLTTGTPGVIYHGGMLHAAVRHFDADAKRAGLPRDVAALVEHVDADSVTLSLVNTSLVESRRVIVQAGAFAEHAFTTAQADEGDSVNVDSSTIEVALAPSAQTRITLGLDRLVHEPTYTFPWDRSGDQPRGRDD